MRRTTCGACGSNELYTFLNLGYSPIADAYTATADEVSKTYPLDVAVCLHCRLAQLLEVVDAETLFGTGYSFYSSASPPLSEYHHRYAQDIIAHHRIGVGPVVEIGCNDGDMLRWFKAAGRVTVGVDPAIGPVEVARDRGLEVWNREFTAKVAWELHETYGRVPLVIANHVLAHVADVDDVLHGIAVLLADDGVAYVEVQYLPDLLVNNAFDLVYHEHRNFFSLTSIENAAAKRGLVVTDARLTQRQQGSLRVRLQHSDRNRISPKRSALSAIRHSEVWLNAGLDAYDGVQGRVDRIRTRLWDTLWDEAQRLQHDGHSFTMAGYGAPAKATTLLNYCGITSDELKFVVDSTPAKQGRFIPGTGIPIVSPIAAADIAGETRGPDVFLLLAWNYAHAIVRAHPEVKRWILPIPAPMVL